ncbi:hypothetical protein SISNIDRAFT_472828 [Sistotremastrum niveocremeum HHB9708]|uniref:E3 ubiquitin-protein ligase PEP5 n=1 Tax=Sistotremastrum niveocremeum HHB9708 TaxID=1314777 RepID=A0A164ZSU0_9AGAM|nr:hypothetical protein SISNIDRAFT_472828 [Sistotremastrum niveocremeum HHB9708]
MTTPGTATVAGAAPTLRQFNFFDVAPVKDAHDLGSTPDIFKIAAVISTGVGVVVADIHGSLHLLKPDFELLKSWVAHNNGRVTHMLEQDGVLITLGEEDALRVPLLKIWDLRKRDKKAGSPLLLRSVKVQHGTRPHPVSAIALAPFLTHLAIGLADGTVLFYRHLDQSLSSGSNSLTALPKPKIVHESPSDPVTGLGFREPSSSDATRGIYLFIVTINRVLSYHASGKGSGASPTVVDEVGSGLGCACMDRKNREIMVAREEAIYRCGIDGRGDCYAYDGTKTAVYSLLGYLVVVSPVPASVSAAPSATSWNYASRPSESANPDATRIAILDLDNKFIAHSGTFPDGIKEVFEGWGHIFVLTPDSKVFRLQEKSTPDKLNILFSKSQFLLSISLAESQALDGASLADIRRKYGDHLYAKGDFDAAMQQYLKTLGHLQPSYVIRKYLDAQRIHNLTTYLQELHSMGLANSDHTTLLLNLYTKLKDVARLDNFIKSEAPRTNSDGSEKDELPFDLETAIRVCRQAGYFDHASYLAEKYARHEDYLRIVVEDKGDYAQALSYLRRLGSEAAESNLARYGRLMLANLPGETTQFLIDLCVGGPSSPEDATLSHTRNGNAGPSYLSYLALNRASATATPPPGPQTTPSSPAAGAGNPDRPARGSAIRTSTHDATRTGTPPPASQLRNRTSVPLPSPRVYFSHFVDHPDHFVNFLESVAGTRWGQTLESTGEQLLDQDTSELEDQKAVWNTLLELYLTLSTSETAEASALREKAIRLLKSKLPHDTTHALILCSTNEFYAGLILLWERLGMYEDILRFWMDKDKESRDPEASKEVLRCVESYGSSHPNLYPLVLRYLTSSPELLTRHNADVSRVLRRIEEEKIMPPLAVVQLLSRNGVASVGLVKQWLMERIKDSREEIQNNRRLVDSYRSETATKLRQIEELSDSTKPRVFHVTRCSTCGGQLDLPSVHFMCNHSYHQRCLADNETECPTCARSNGVIREIRRNNERLANQHDLFLHEVAENGFEAVASGFGRGWMDMARPEGVFE